MKRVLAALGAAGILVAALTIGQALCLGFCIANLWSGQALATQMGLIGGFLACFSGRQVAGYIRDRALERYSARIADGLREKLLTRTFCGTPLLGRAEGTAALAEMATKDVDAIGAYVRSMPAKLGNMATISLPLLIAEFHLDWVSGLILLITVPVIFYFMMLLGRSARQRAAEQYERYRFLSNSFIDTLRGLPTLLSFHAAEAEDRRIYAASEQLRESSIGTIGIATLSSALLDLTATLGVAGVAMMLAFRLLDGSIALWCGLSALMLAPEFYTPLRTFAADFHSSLDAKQGLRRLLRVLALPNVQDPNAEVPPWTDKSVLRAEGLSFSYEGHRALEGVGLTLRAGQHIGVIGPSGAGKSTLANLLAGFQKPESGRFTLDGQQLSSLATKGWTRQVHYIPQEPALLRASLKDNVALYRPDATDAEVREALAKVELGPLIEELPDGVHSAIGDAGRALSGGQVQRIALARAILDPRPILIFDEPTAHLDIETELALQPAIVRLMEGRTVIFATHRLRWLDEMDEVIRIEEGKVHP